MSDMSLIDPADLKKPWYLAQLRPNSLRIAERNLLRQGFRVFCPLRVETRKAHTRFRTTESPLFPGYLFVRFDPEVSGWRAVNSTYGVSRLVAFGGRPAPVPAPLVAALRLRCDASGRIQPTEDLGSGDPVRIVAGPFADFVATVEELAPDRRVWVLLEIMGRPTRVVLSRDMVQQMERGKNSKTIKAA